MVWTEKTPDKDRRNRDKDLKHEDREAHIDRKVRRVRLDRVDHLQHMEMLDSGEDL